jgi:hypothetical protein
MYYDFTDLHIHRTVKDELSAYKILQHFTCIKRLKRITFYVRLVQRQCNAYGRCVSDSIVSGRRFCSASCEESRHICYVVDLSVDTLYPEYLLSVRCYILKKKKHQQQQTNNNNSSSNNNNNNNKHTNKQTTATTTTKKKSRSW